MHPAHIASFLLMSKINKRSRTWWHFEAGNTTHICKASGTLHRSISRISKTSFDSVFKENRCCAFQCVACCSFPLSSQPAAWLPPPFILDPGLLLKESNRKMAPS